MRMAFTQLRQDGSQQVNALSIHQPAECHDCDGLVAAPPVCAAGWLHRLLLLHVLWPLQLRFLPLLSLLPSPPLLLMMRLLLLHGLWLKQRGVHGCRQEGSWLSSITRLSTDNCTLLMASADSQHISPLCSRARLEASALN